MDHLTDVQIAFVSRVPLVCSQADLLSLDISRERTYQDFYDLPKVLKWEVQEENGQKISTVFGASFHVMTQRWLYFEVLAQFFGHLPSFKWQDFVTEDSSWITTKYLQRNLDAWWEHEQKSRQKSRIVRIQQVLDRARYFVSRYCTVEKAENNPKWEVQDILALSYMVLGETLTRAQKKILDSLRFDIDGWISHKTPTHGWGYSKLILVKLENAKWCRKAVHMLQSSLRGNTIGLLYLYTLRDSSAKGRQHILCTATECRADELDGKKLSPDPYHHCRISLRDRWSKDEIYYETSGPNAAQSSRCASTTFKGEIPGEKLAKIIDKGKIPLLRFNSEAQPPTLEVHEASQSLRDSYAVFSHVWSDGFGNFQNKNELNLCVLNLFSKLLKDAVALRAENSVIPKLFWIDTLAIPVQDEYATQRRKAINQMHSIYTHANYTIVLDRSLMEVSVGPGFSNPAMKISMCKWMTRLWTLQEAVLSKNLFFVFQDKLCSLDYLEDLYVDEESTLHCCVPAVSRGYWHGIIGPKRDDLHKKLRENSHWLPDAGFVAEIWRATQWRSTAHLIHETLSLATMLNVNTNPFAQLSRYEEDTPGYQIDCDNRMVQLLLQFASVDPCPIPPGMIFLPGPRLSKKGFGWAPKTWLSSQQIDSPDPLSYLSSGITRLDPSEGLEVQFPGFLLHDLGVDRKTLRDRGQFCFATNSTLLDWYSVEPAEDTKNFPAMEKLQNRELAIIACRLPTVDLKEIALFVGINQNKKLGGICYVEILNRVWIGRVEGQNQLKELRENFRNAHADALTAAQRLSPDTKWCVDGPSQPADAVEDLEDWYETNGVVIGESSKKQPVPLIKRAFTSLSNKTVNKSWPRFSRGLK